MSLRKLGHVIQPRNLNQETWENLVSGIKKGHDLESGLKWPKLYVLELPLACCDTRYLFAEWTKKQMEAKWWGNGRMSKEANTESEKTAKDQQGEATKGLTKWALRSWQPKGLEYKKGICLWAEAEYYTKTRCKATGWFRKRDWRKEIRVELIREGFSQEVSFGQIDFSIDSKQYPYITTATFSVSYNDIFFENCSKTVHVNQERGRREKQAADAMYNNVNGTISFLF